MEALPPLPPTETIRDQAAEILRHPDYKLTPTPDDSALIRFIAKSVEAFIKWIDTTLGISQLSPFMWWTLMIGLSVVALAIIVHIIYTFRVGTASPRDTTRLTELSSDSDEPTVWERRAREAVQSGDTVQALRFFLIAGILRLELAQKKRLRRGFTNRELLRRYKDTPAHEPLRVLVDRVDETWYGGAPCAGDDAAGAGAAYAKIVTAAEGLRRAHGA